MLNAATVVMASAGQSDRAAQLNPSSGFALSRNAEAHYAARRFGQAADFARRAIGEAPFEVRAVRTLGLSMLALGQAQGGSVMLRAGALGWRDTPTQDWLIQQAALQNDFETVVQRVDGLMRRQRNGGRMLDLLHRIAAFPQGRKAIVARLSDGAPWQGRFFNMLHHLQPGEFGAHAQLLADYHDAGGMVGRAQAAPFANRLASQGRIAEARRVWLAWSRSGKRAAEATINDSGFTAVRSGADSEPAYPFEWRFREGAAFAAIGEPPVPAGGTALQARSDGTSESVIAHQTVLLRPGTQRIGYDVLADSPAARLAFGWALRCLPGNQLIRSEPASGASAGAWLRTSVTFQIPASGCSAQKLELRALDGVDPVEAWFDNVQHIG